MSALDGSVVNTVLPLINQGFRASLAAVEWVVVIYLLVLSGLLLSFGRLGDLRGHKSIYVLGFGIFILCSALCGFSTNLWGLIAFRAGQALGAAMLAANSPAILTKNFPARQRGQALGLQATMTYLGLTVGPSLGGWLAGQYGWQAVFFINIPVGALALYLSVRFIPSERITRSNEKFDIPGALLFITGLVALLLGLNQGHALGWLSLPIIGLLSLAGVSLAAFVVQENKSAYPMVDLRLFSRHSFSLAVTGAVVNYMCVYTILFLMPFYLLQGLKLNPAQAGLYLSAQPVIMAIVAPLAGTISDKIGIRRLTSLGMALLAIGLFLLARLGPQSSTGEIIFAMGICGLGTGIFISPNTSGLMGSAPRNRQGIAAGILATSRNVGMVLGVGMAGAIFTTILAQTSPVAGQNLYQALHISFLCSAVIALIGLFVSLANKESNQAASDPVTSIL